MRRALLHPLLILLVLVAAVFAPATSAAAQDAPPSTPVPVPHIIPRPNTGHAPHDAGDRGGALQLVLPVLLVAAVGGGAWHLTREARRAKQDRA